MACKRHLVAKFHKHIKNQREDYLHKASIHIVRSFDTICLEDLNIEGLMQNEKLALAIGEVGWHKFKTMLEYKPIGTAKTFNILEGLSHLQCYVAIAEICSKN